MQVVNENGLEFSDLKLKIVEGKINTDLYSKITNSFTYALPSTYYPYKNIWNAPKGIALRLQRACDNDEKYNHCFSEYQNYLIGRLRHLCKKQFEEVGRMTRTKAKGLKQ